MQPMLASPVTLEQVQYPVYVSAKLDGIRCVGTDEGPKTRSLKRIPNEYTRKMLSDKIFTGFDGELIVGPPAAEDVFAKTTSGIMSAAGRPDFTWYVFDKWDEPDKPYTTRLLDLYDANDKSPWGNTLVLAQDWVNNEEELLAAEHQYLELGYEGVIVRAPYGRYKYGRSTWREGLLLKRKPLADAEGLVIGFNYLEINLNEQTKDERGYAKRSNQQDNQLVDYGRMGALQVRVLNGPFEGAVVSIGTGFTDEQRRLFAGKDRLASDYDIIGTVVNFTYQLSGSKDAPRFPSFKGIRKD